MNFFKRPVITDTEQDEVLLERYRRDGDLAILGKLFERYMPLVYGVCLKYLKDEEKAKDGVMGIFEELITKTRRHEVEKFRPWLYVLSRNYCLMQLRSSKKIETILLDDVMELMPFMHHESQDQDLLAGSLTFCIEKLPLVQKRSITLFYLEEKCYKEIAATTGFSMNEVKSYIQNGKRNLKICLENNREQ
jgi:RNA polymerase sigma-70 factor (ECF subfamily)